MIEDRYTTLEKVLNMLETETFRQWHGEGKFADYIDGVSLTPPTKDEILEDLWKMLK